MNRLREMEDFGVEPSVAKIKPPMEKPPLGLRPRWIVDEHRAKEITEAIRRYRAEGKEIPPEWTEEFMEIQDRKMKDRPDANVKPGQSAVNGMVCIDDLGEVGLTKGKAYSVLAGDNGLIRVENDLGDVREYFPERFEKI